MRLRYTHVAFIRKHKPDVLNLVQVGRAFGQAGNCSDAVAPDELEVPGHHDFAKAFCGQGEGSKVTWTEIEANLCPKIGMRRQKGKCLPVNALTLAKTSTGISMRSLSFPARRVGFLSGAGEPEGPDDVALPGA